MCGIIVVRYFSWSLWNRVKRVINIKNVGALPEDHEFVGGKMTNYGDDAYVGKTATGPKRCLWREDP
jgi:hypothetical protein